MGVASIDDVLGRVHSESSGSFSWTARPNMKSSKGEINSLLCQYHDDGKEPNPVAKGMSWMKVGVKMGMDDSDKTVSDLMTDGCNMGVKSLNKYLNEYTAADEVSKDIAKRLINLEEKLAIDIREFL